MRFSFALFFLVAVAIPRVAHAGDGDLKKRLKSLERENRKLEADLGREQAASAAAFEAASGAEATAGLTFSGMTVYVPETKPEAAPPVNVEYVRLHVRHADYSVVPTSFSAARIVANHRLYSGVTSVKRTNKR